MKKKWIGILKAIIILSICALAEIITLNAIGKLQLLDKVFYLNGGVLAGVILSTIFVKKETKEK
ncbi:hypothetical protein [Clostridium massiliodielmoense]|uniref:hypothetical protein n=1 Tax=Clostridium massiliodielmoense TaxID=1776385 RepID=UPI000A26BFA5|nr:hypothetical protein [Clostridium massiliodielmoense]